MSDLTAAASGAGDSQRAISSQSLQELFLLKSTTTADDIRTFYDKWASTYDADVTEIGYVPHRSCAAQLARHVTDRDARILDVAAGTGLVASELRKLGFANMDALDISEKMLEKAREKNLYHRYFVGAIACPEVIQCIPANTYDATVSAGAFTQGHIKAKGLDDLVHVTKLNGIVCVSVREDVLDDADHGSYRQRVGQLAADGHVDILFQDYVEYHQLHRCMCFVMRKLK